MIPGVITPATSVADELADVDTAYGRMPKWKARALSVGWMQRVADSVRADDAKDPPKAVADPEETAPRMAADKGKRDASFTGGGFGKSPAKVFTDNGVSSEVIKKLNDLCDGLEQRLDKLEQVKRA